MGNNLTIMDNQLLEQKILEIRLMEFRLQRNFKELEMAELEREKTKEKLEKIENYIRELNFIISEHMLEIQNEIVEIKMMISPESFKEVTITMEELMEFLERDNQSLKNIPENIRRMNGHGSENIQNGSEIPY